MDNSYTSLVCIAIYIYIMLISTSSPTGAIGLSGAFFGEGQGPIFLDNADCSPTNHTTIISCFDVENEVGVHNCEHREDASVICPCQL